MLPEESTGIAFVGPMAGLQALHAGAVSKTTPALLDRVGAALLEIVTPAQGLVVASLCVKTRQLSRDLRWSFSTWLWLLGIGGCTGRSGPCVLAAGRF